MFNYAREAADWSTDLPQLDFAVRVGGKEGGKEEKEGRRRRRSRREGGVGAML